MKKYLVAAALIIFTTGAALAQSLPEMEKFLKAVVANPARAPQGTKINFVGWPKTIETGTNPAGIQFATIQFTFDKLNGVLTNWGVGKMVCVTEMSQAAKLTIGQRATISGVVFGVETVNDVYTNGTVIPQVQVVANCVFGM